MPYTTVDANGHVSGSILGIESAIGVVDSFPHSGGSFPAKPTAHYSSDMTYVVAISNVGTPVYKVETKRATLGTDYGYFQFVMYSPYDGVTNKNVEFLRTSDSGPCFRLKAEYDTGDLEISDQAGTVVYTESGFFEAGKWYQFEIKFERKATSGEFVLKAGEWGQGQSTILDTTFDTLNSSDATVGLMLGCNYTPQSTLAYHYFGQYLFRTDAEATIDHVDGSPWHPYGANVLGAYHSASQARTVDVTGGDNLPPGTNWGNPQEDPASTAIAKYTTTSSGPDLEGIMSCDHASEGGPFGDSRLTGSITGAMVAFRGKAPSGGTQPDITHLYGSIPFTTPSVDGTLASSKYNGTGAFVSKTYMIQIADAEFPDQNADIMQFGFRASASFSAGDVDLEAMVASVWHVLPAPAAPGGGVNLSYIDIGAMQRREAADGSPVANTPYMDVGGIQRKEAVTAGADKFGAAVLDSTATQTVAGQLDVSGASALGSAATLTTVPDLTLGGAVVLGGVSTLAATAGFDIGGAAALDGTATLAALAGLDVGGAVAVDGTATLDSLAGLDLPGVVALDGVGTMDSAGVLDASGAGVLDGVATLVVIGSVGNDVPGAAILSGVGSLDSSASIDLAGASLLEAAATLGVVGGLDLFGDLVLDGAAVMSTQSGLDLFGDLVLDGVASVSALANLDVGVAMAISGTATMASLGILDAGGASVLGAVGTITTAPTMVLVGASVLAGVATLTTAGATDVDVTYVPMRVGSGKMSGVGIQ